MKLPDSMNVDIVAFMTPDGRWNMLQDWLEEHPTHNAILESWLKQTPEEVFPQIKDIAATIASRKYGPLGGALVQVTKLTPEIRHWIEDLQTLYRERQEDGDGKQRRIGRTNREGSQTPA